MSKRFRLLLSAAFALLALLGCLAYGDAVRSEAEAEREEAIQRYGGEVTTIVVAAEDLEVGDVVSAVNCEERDWASDLVPEGVVTSLDETAGAALSSPLSKGTPLTEAALRDAAETLDIPAGMAAYTISVNERTGVLSSVPLGTTLVAYQVVDGGTQFISANVQVIGRDPDGGSKITVAVPYEDLSPLIQAATDRSLRLAQPSGLSEELADLAVEEEGTDAAPPDEAQGQEGYDESASEVPEAGADPVEGDPWVEEGAVVPDEGTAVPDYSEEVPLADAEPAPDLGEGSW